MSGRLILDPEIVETLTTGTVRLPRFSTGFPAELIETEMEWDDVVCTRTPCVRAADRALDPVQRTVLDEWGMRKRVKPGYRPLFHGPPGTRQDAHGDACRRVHRPTVFRIGLSRVVSKYIGETEKNLARLFNKAEHKEWTLF